MEAFHQEIRTMEMKLTAMLEADNEMKDKYHFNGMALVANENPGPHHLDDINEFINQDLFNDQKRRHHASTISSSQPVNNDNIPPIPKPKTTWFPTTTPQKNENTVTTQMTNGCNGIEKVVFKTPFPKAKQRYNRNRKAEGDNVGLTSDPMQNHMEPSKEQNNKMMPLTPPQN